MKKFLLFGLSLVAVLSLSACNNEGNKTKTHHDYDDAQKILGDGDYVVGAKDSGSEVTEGTYYLVLTRMTKEKGSKSGSVSIDVYENQDEKTNNKYNPKYSKYFEELNNSLKLDLTKDEVITVDSSSCKDFTISLLTPKQYEEYLSDNDSETSSSTPSSSKTSSKNAIDENNLDGTWQTEANSDGDRVTMTIDGEDVVITGMGNTGVGTIDTSDKTMDINNEYVEYKIIGNQLVVTEDEQSLAFTKDDSKK